MSRISVALVLALAACAPARTYVPPTVAVAPAHVATQSAQMQPATTANPFWHEIGDTILSGLITDALESNMDVRVAQSRLDASRASRRLAMYAFVPTLSATGSALRTKQSIAQAYGLSGTLPQTDLFDMGVDAGVEIDLFGRTRHNVAAQSARVAASQHSLENVRLELAAEVARTYFELRGSQQQLGVAQRNADAQRRSLTITEDRLAAGRGAGLDVERARSILQLTLASVPDLNAQIAEHVYHIAMLLGRTPDRVPTALTVLGTPPTLPESVTIGSPEQLIRNRPDVLAAERVAAAQSLTVQAAQAEYLPRVSIGASVGYTSTQVDSWTQNSNLRFLFGPTVSMPLLDLGRVRERVDIAQAAQKEAQAQYTSAVLHALEEAESAIARYDRAHERVALLTVAVSSSTKALDLAQQRFEAGLTDFLQVLDAQRTLLDAESQLSAARTNAGTALVDLYRAAGGTSGAR